MGHERATTRYVIGFDLGTTNSAVTYVDTAKEPWRIETFAAAQLVAPGQIEARESLPSFHYQPAAGELAAGALKCPWHQTEPAFAVGVFARDHGAMVPGRLINSAKSWLCHTGVDRTAPLLPWHGAADVERLSPVEVSPATWATSATPGTPASPAIRWPSKSLCSPCRLRLTRSRGN